jgi:hypothetical protein
MNKILSVLLALALLFVSVAPGFSMSNSEPTQTFGGIIKKLALCDEMLYVGEGTHVASFSKNELMMFGNSPTPQNISGYLGGLVSDIACSGSTVYVLASDVLSILDSSLVIVGQYKSPTVQGIRAPKLNELVLWPIDEDPQLAIIANSDSYYGGGIEVVDVTYPSSPTLKQIVSEGGNGIWSLGLSGNYLFAGTNNVMMHQYEISASSLTTITTDTYLGDVARSWVFDSAGFAYIGMNDQVQRWDISQTSGPQYVETRWIYGTAQKLVVTNNKLYISVYNEEYAEMSGLRYVGLVGFANSFPETLPGNVSSEPWDFEFVSSNIAVIANNSQGLRVVKLDSLQNRAIPEDLINSYVPPSSVIGGTVSVDGTRLLIPSRSGLFETDLIGNVFRQFSPEIGTGLPTGVVKYGPDGSFFSVEKDYTSGYDHIVRYGADPIPLGVITPTIEATFGGKSVLKPLDVAEIAFQQDAITTTMIVVGNNWQYGAYAQLCESSDGSFVCKQSVKLGKFLSERAKEVKVVGAHAWILMSNELQIRALPSLELVTTWTPTVEFELNDMAVVANDCSIVGQDTGSYAGRLWNVKFDGGELIQGLNYLNFEWATTKIASSDESIWVYQIPDTLHEVDAKSRSVAKSYSVPTDCITYGLNAVPAGVAVSFGECGVLSFANSVAPQSMKRLFLPVVNK